MVLQPQKLSTVYKVRFWDPRPIAEGGNNLPDDIYQGLFEIYRDMQAFFGIRRQMYAGNRVEVKWHGDQVSWDAAIRNRERRLFYIYNEERKVFAIGEVFASGWGQKHVRVYVLPEYRGQGAGTSLHGVIEQCYYDDTMFCQFVFNEFDVKRVHDGKPIEKWLLANNYTGGPTEWRRDLSV